MGAPVAGQLRERLPAPPVGIGKRHLFIVKSGGGRSHRQIEALSSSRRFFKGRESLDGLPGLLFGCAKFVEGLEIEPEFRASAEEVGKTQSGVSGYGAPAIDNFRDAIGGDLELARESGGAHIKGL